MRFSRASNTPAGSCFRDKNVPLLVHMSFVSSGFSPAQRETARREPGRRQAFDVLALTQAGEVFGTAPRAVPNSAPGNPTSSSAPLTPLAAARAGKLSSERDVSGRRRSRARRKLGSRSIHARGGVFRRLLLSCAPRARGGERTSSARARRVSASRSSCFAKSSALARAAPSSSSRAWYRDLYCSRSRSADSAVQQRGVVRHVVRGERRRRQPARRRGGGPAGARDSPEREQHHGDERDVRNGHALSVPPVRQAVAHREAPRDTRGVPRVRRLGVWRPEIGNRARR